MTFDERFQDPNFINNQAEIESDWDSTYGDRKKMRLSLLDNI